jgi:hypothetical protein
MEKYIDAEKLKAHIEAKMEILWNRLPDADKEHPTDIELRDLGMYMALEGLIDDLDSLQQEQPEVDFKIEERKWVHDAVDNIFPEDGDFMSEVDFRKILKDTVRHFYELGQCNARKEEKK